MSKDNPVSPNASILLPRKCFNDIVLTLDNIDGLLATELDARLVMCVDNAAIIDGSIDSEDALDVAKIAAARHGIDSLLAELSTLVGNATRERTTRPGGVAGQVRENTGDASVRSFDEIERELIRCRRAIRALEILGDTDAVESLHKCVSSLRFEQMAALAERVIDPQGSTCRTAKYCTNADSTRYGTT